MTGNNRLPVAICSLDIWKIFLEKISRKCASETTSRPRSNFGKQQEIQDTLSEIKHTERRLLKIFKESNFIFLFTNPVFRPVNSSKKKKKKKSVWICHVIIRVSMVCAIGKINWKLGSLDWIKLLSPSIFSVNLWPLKLC